MLLQAVDLKKSFPERGVEALRGVSFSIARGQTLGIMGESGSGKSTLAKIVLGILKPDSGETFFEGVPFKKFDKNNFKNFRRKVQGIFQNPALSLDPRMRVRDILREPYLIHGALKVGGIDRNIRALLDSVELNERFLDRFPRQLSGGECQRVAIARALSTDPELIVCDEAVSSLDLLIQAGILNLLLKLQKERSVSYLFITHDPAVARHMSDQILIIKEGRVLIQ